MKILLLGAGGQLGTEWDRYLQSRTSDLQYAAYGSSDLDITDTRELEKVVRRESPGIVINCAAYTKVDRAEEEPDKARQINSLAVASLAQLCADAGVKLLHYSTDYVFPGRKEDRQQFPGGYAENHQVRPGNVYGRTKWEGEEAIRRSGCSHIIIRVSWLCGQYGHNFVKTMLRLAEEKSSLDVVDDQWGSPTFTDATVENSQRLIDEEAEGTYHLTSDGLITWADFAEVIFKCSGKQVEISRVRSDSFPVKAERPFFSKLNTNKIKQVPGVELEDWKVGLQRLLNKMEAI